MVCMHAIHYYHSVCIDEYTVLLIYIHVIYLNNLQLIALLEMVCITYQHMAVVEEAKKLGGLGVYPQENFEKGTLR